MSLRKKKHNIIFITVDSCRYDTAEKAKVPFLSNLSKLRKAETHGDYTFPAHQSFFIGNLPVLIDGNSEYIEGITQFWRSSAAKKINSGIGVVYSEKNIIDHYEKQGYRVLGCGGVSFFKKRKTNSLPLLFSNFKYFQKTTSGVKLPREKNEFPLANIDEILTFIKLKKNIPYFLFLNSPATHIPYDNPESYIDDSYRKTIEKLYFAERQKPKRIKTSEIFTTKEINKIKIAQVLSLEWVDKQLNTLVKELQKMNTHPILMVVCGDHGDEWGEGGRYCHAHYHEKVVTVPLWAGIIN